MKSSTSSSGPRKASSVYVHPEADTPGINDNIFTRTLTLAAWKCLRRWRPRRGIVHFLTPHLCLKTDLLTPLSEAWALRYMATHTNIPVPKVYCAFRRGDRTFLLMQRLPGEMLGYGWQDRSPESRAQLLAQLKDMVAEMRQLDPSTSPFHSCRCSKKKSKPSHANSCKTQYPHRVASVTGGPLWDGRCPCGPVEYFGPFDDVPRFHRAIRRSIDDPPLADLQELIALQQDVESRVVFTHGDLSSFNVLAQGDTITGIVDWETAGWYPSYWEYGQACCYVHPCNPWWRPEVDRFLDPVPRQLRLAQLQHQYFGELPCPKIEGS